PAPSTAHAPSAAHAPPTAPAPASTPPRVSGRSGGSQRQRRDSDRCGDLSAEASYGIGRHHRDYGQATNPPSSPLRQNVSCPVRCSRIERPSLQGNDRGLLKSK